MLIRSPSLARCRGVQRYCLLQNITGCRANGATLLRTPRPARDILPNAQGDLMLNLIEVLGPELDKKATVIYRHNVMEMIEGVIKTSTINPEEAEEVAKIGVKIFGGSESDT